MPARKAPPATVTFEQPYPSAQVAGDGYVLAVPAAQQDGTGWVCSLNVLHNGASTAANQDNVRVTDTASVTEFLEAVRAVLPKALRTKAQREAWRIACGAIAANIAEAVARQIAAQQAAQPAVQSQATRLVALAADIEVFHTPTQDTFAAFKNGDHREVWSLRSKAFRDWLARQFYLREHTNAGSQALQDALTTLSGRAQFEGAEHEVYVRFAPDPEDDSIWLDLANATWQTVHVAADGWSVVDEPTVYFRRPRSMRALPTPTTGGNLEDLRRFIRPETDADWRLRVAWELGACNPRGPYPVFNLNGGQGTIKTTAQRVLRKLIDPNQSLLRAAPREERDLLIAATNSWVCGFDNVSVVSDWLSDALCRLSTGSGLSTRTLYTDEDETVLSVARPVLFNGIEDLVLRGDLQDRSIVQAQPEIGEDERLDEAEFWRQFDEAHPQLLGALLDALSVIVRDLPTTRPRKLPRMADFARWVCAAESALGWKAGQFLEDYANSRANAAHVIADASPLVAPIAELVPATPRLFWEGKATELLHALEASFSEDELRVLQRPRSGWPRTPAHLSGALRRLAPTLRSVVQIDAQFPVGGQHQRRIRLERMAPQEESSGKSAPPPPPPPPRVQNGAINGGAAESGSATIGATAETPKLNSTEATGGAGGAGGADVRTHSNATQDLIAEAQASNARHEAELAKLRAQQRKFEVEL